MQIWWDGLLKEDESEEVLYTHNHSSIIHSGQEVEATQMSADE